MRSSCFVQAKLTCAGIHQGLMPEPGVCQPQSVRRCTRVGTQTVLFGSMLHHLPLVQPSCDPRSGPPASSAVVVMKRTWRLIVTKQLHDRASLAGSLRSSRRCRLGSGGGLLRGLVRPQLVILCLDGWAGTAGVDCGAVPVWRF